MTLKLSILATFFLLALNVQSQVRPAIAWQKCLGGSGDDKANDILPTNDGGYIVVGSSTSNDEQVTGHHGSTDSMDAWVIKLDAAGNLQWQRSLGGSNQEEFLRVIATADDNYLCIGYTRSADGDLLFNWGGTDCWLVKINASGNVLWSRNYGGSENDKSVDAVLISNGGFAVSGTTFSSDGDIGSDTTSATNSCAWVFYCNAAGDITWEKTFSGYCNRDGYSIVRNSANELAFLTSSCSSYVAGLWPYQVTVQTTPGVIYFLDDNNGAINRTQNMGGGDNRYAMVKTPYGLWMSYISRYYQYLEYCYVEYTNLGSLPNGSNNFTYATYNITQDCTDYNHVTLTRPAAVSGLASTSDGNTMFVGYQGYTNSDDKNGFIRTSSGYIYTYGGTYYDAFNSIKVSQDGNEYICAGYTHSSDGDLTGINPHISTGYFHPDVWVIKLSSVNRIQGRVFLDVNNNNTFDAGEPPFNHAQVRSARNGFSTYSNPYNGIFLNQVDTGTFTTTVSLNGRPYYTVTPASKQTVFTAFKSTDTINFAVHRIPGIRDYVVTLTPATPARPGFGVQYKIGYGNYGTDTMQNKLIRFVKSNHLQFLQSAPAATNINGDTITWYVNNVVPDSMGYITVNLRADSIPALFPGDSLRSTVYIDSTADIAQNNNYALLVQEVRGSYDPNDKSEVHGAGITPDEVLDRMPLVYTIRFQNTGNDTAFNIIIRDTLDNNLDGTSLQLLSASHACSVKVQQDKYVSFTFSNINLPDSLHHEPLSHGLISYSILPKATLVAGNQISNSAAIYFDYNPPVITNKTLTVVKERVNAVWTGAVDAAWENKLNWSSGAVPDQSTNVTIPAAVPNFPVLNSNAVCYSLTVQQGATINVQPGYNLFIRGKN